MCDNDQFELLCWSAGIGAILLGGLLYLWLYIVPPHPNTVWATVESSVEMRVEWSVSYDITVLFTVEDGEYTGTYRGHFNSPNKYDVDEVILLSATKDYSSVSDINYGDPVNSWLDKIKVVSVTCLIVGSVFIVIAWIFAVNDTGGFDNTSECTTDDLESCIQNIRRISRHSLNNDLESCIQDVRRISGKCECKPYAESLLEIVESMEKQLKSLECSESLVVPETEELYKARRDNLKKTFKNIREIASKTALKMYSDSSEEDLQRAVYQLQSYLELASNESEFI